MCAVLSTTGLGDSTIRGSEQFCLIQCPLIVDDDDGGLWEIPFSVDGDEVEFGESTQVKTEYVDVEASVIFTDKVSSRKGMKMPEIREELGLAADSSDQDVDKALSEQIAALTAEQDSRKKDDDSESDKESEASEDKSKKDESSSLDIPDGMTMIDKEVLAELKDGATAGRKAHAVQIKASRDQILDTAIKVGGSFLRLGASTMKMR